MIAIAIRFLAGRYHATPWGRHVNEGVPEWPPSHWRFLRALVSSWKRNHPEYTSDKVSKLLGQLSAPPLIWLPPATVGHTRHYMPWFKKGPVDSTLVFDTFTALEKDQEVRLIWPDAVMDHEVMNILAGLLKGLTYLGRAESWCQARVDEDPPEPNCHPLESGHDVPEGNKVIRVLAAAPVEAGRLLEALMVEIADLRSKQKRLNPPHSSWVSYAQSQDSLAVVQVKPYIARRMKDSPVVAARFALDRQPLPPVQDTLLVGERARQAAMSRYGRLNDGQLSEILAGRTGNLPSRGHRHSFYLPADEDADGRIDHLTVFAPGGLEKKEQQALGSITDIFWADREGRGPQDEMRKLKVLLLGFLKHDELGQYPGIFGASRYWTSKTPFVLSRYPKVYRDGRPKTNQDGFQVDGPEDQIKREWDSRRQDNPSLPRLLNVKLIDRLSLREGKDIRWLSFRTQRQKGKGISSGFVYGLALEFEKPIIGPVALGYGCHFGLGQFIPILK